MDCTFNFDVQPCAESIQRETERNRERKIKKQRENS